MSRNHCHVWLGFILAVGMAGFQPGAAGILRLTAFADAARNRTSAQRINPIDGAEMVDIPPGEFIMGSDADEIDRLWRKFNWNEEWKQHTKGEQPAHRVRVDGFRIYRANVTIARYRQYCEKTKRPMPLAPSWGWTDTHPVVNVSWEDAKAYCSWAGARLPYEAEWEYAAQGGNTGLGGRPRTVFVWGNEYPRNRVANLADESFRKSSYHHLNFRLFDGYNDGYTHTSPGGAFPPNGFGLYDMAGNVWQWCEDWAEADYYRLSPSVNPHGPANGQRRVLRGGAFDTTPEITRISRRVSNSPLIRHDEKGFRCVQENETKERTRKARKEESRFPRLAASSSPRLPRSLFFPHRELLILSTRASRQSPVQSWSLAVPEGKPPEKQQ